MDMEYNLDELDAALSERAHQVAAVAGPPTNDSRRTAPSTRRGSLIPGVIINRSKQYSINELNLFNFDLRELVREILLTSGESQVSYHEYAVYAAPDSEADGEPRSPSIMSSGEDGRRMFQNAMRHGHSLDSQGNFTASPKGKRSLQGRVRQVIADRRIRYDTPNGTGTGTLDGLELTVEDYETLGLHPGTLPSVQRVTIESSFWDSRRDTLYLIFSFSTNPQPPYDFLSMAYKIRTRTTTALIRRSFDTRWHDEDSLDEYERRLDSCRARWAHPLVLPVVLLQVQLLRTEEAVLANNGEVLNLEAHVDAVTGNTGQANARANRRNKAKYSENQQHHFAPLKRLSTLRDMVEEKVGHGHGHGQDRQSQERPGPSPTPEYSDPDYVPPQTIHLMKEAHDVLKGAIQLLDTLRWMERAVKLLIQAGDELDARVKELRAQAVAKGEANSVEGDDQDELTFHWYEIRQYLDCTWRLCTALETDRRMSELRCRAQIDIIYSKMAQEDNNLNARMAVASTRDSSSMKALAVITAIFLPGEYIGTLFGISMFNWEEGTAGDPALSEDAPSGLPHPVVMPSFWVYWAFTIPLTLFIVTLWRAWWVNQDRYFRRHLSNELSNERYWTTDGKPRDLETTFMQDFFSLFSRSGSRSTTNSTILGNRSKSALSGASSSSAAADRPQSQSPPGPGLLKRGTTFSQRTSMGKDAREATDSEGEGATKAIRFRQISFAREPRPRDGGSAV
ncbi:hypothetical protein F4809DRAFT_604599 [Biscogniauxia mediterranea]|nr:hypothetical protein F4809DRAFT_604599 [Biscogniauxia mediterranea]